MKLLSVLLSVAGVSSLAWVYPVAAETIITAEGAERAKGEILFPSPPNPQRCAFPCVLRRRGVAPQFPNNDRGTAADLLTQGVTRVTGVEIKQTEEGLELILETVSGSERLVPLIVSEGNDLVIEILDATLAFELRNGFTELNPVTGITKITVNKAEENSIQVRITGENQTPSAEVVPGKENLVLSIAPEGATAEQEPDDSINVIATGQGAEDDYFVPNASTATRTDTPIRDIPQSIQVIR